VKIAKQLRWLSILKLLGAGRWKVEYFPTRVGRYSMKLSVNGNDILQYLLFEVVTGPFNTSGVELKVTVQARDRFGNAVEGETSTL
jgi:hypothetical protein